MNSHLSETTPISNIANTDSAAISKSSTSSYYALSLFFLINILVLTDRQILTVLAEEIKTDIGLSDSELGFLYGTAISVFYSVFAIPIGKLADVWVRKRILGLSILACSSMIFLTGTARNFISFGLCRIGVGVGEAGAAPAAMSLITDLFPARKRSLALSVFSAGVPIGGGLGVWLGGFVVDQWTILYPDTSAAPFNLRGWQVAFFIVALFGPLLAYGLLRLVEPKRGALDAIATPEHHSEPFGEAWAMAKSVLPLVSLNYLVRRGGTKAVITNLLAGLVIALVALWLINITGSTAQWSALAVGFWCLFCWAQTLSYQDPVSYGMILQGPALLCSNLGIAAYVLVVSGIAAWIAPFLMRAHGLSAGEVGGKLGLLTAICGILGTVSGGALSDALENYTPRARAYVMLASMVLVVPSAIMLIHETNVDRAFVYAGLFLFASTTWYGIGSSLANSLVLPRMRAVSSAFYLVVISLLGIAMGPYLVGYISDTIAADGITNAHSLRTGISWVLMGMLPATILLSLTTYFIAHDQASLQARAIKYGENIKDAS